jgi:hypothetical protein
MKSNRKSTRQSDRLTYSSLQKRDKPTDRANEKAALSVTEGYSRPTDQPAKQIIEQTFCLK